MLHPVPPAFLKQARTRCAVQPPTRSECLPQLAADMELFRQLPGGVQRQASPFARDVRSRVRAEPVCLRCGSWTTRCSSATLRRQCLLMPTRLQPCCASWTWCAHARACTCLGVSVFDARRPLATQSCVLAAIPGQTGAAGAAPTCTGKLGGVAARPLPALSRKALRSASASVQRLVRLVRELCAIPCGSRNADVSAGRYTLQQQVGSSRRLYTCVVRICRQHFASSGIIATCTLRSQLLMALHDASTHGNAASANAFKEVCEPDKCHKLAWLLDACLKVRLSVSCPCTCTHSTPRMHASQDGFCDQRRLKEICAHLEALEKAAQASAVSKQRLAAKLGRRGAAESENSDGGDGTGRPEDAALSNLADAGMILRDPAVLHMLLHETVRAAAFRVTVTLLRLRMSVRFARSKAWSNARPCPRTTPACAR